MLSICAPIDRAGLEANMRRATGSRKRFQKDVRLGVVPCIGNTPSEFGDSITPTDYRPHSHSKGYNRNDRATFRKTIRLI